MKKVFLLFTLLLFLPFTTAQEEEDRTDLLKVQLSISKAGVGPDFPLFWNIDRFLERMQLRITKAEFKYEVRMQHAEERLAEVKSMLEKKRIKAMEKAQLKYGEEIEKLQKEKMTEQIRQRVMLNLQKHIQVLQTVRNKSPQQAFIGLDQAIKTGQRNIERYRVVVSEQYPVGMANPASVFCQQQGGKSEIRTNPDGSQAGYCIFPDGTKCEEWSFFKRHECGQKFIKMY